MFCSYTRHIHKNGGMTYAPLRATHDAGKIKIFRKKSAFFQRIADFVRSGHSHYVQGTTAVEKYAKLHHKFSQRYEIDRSHLQAFRARAKGLASYKLLGWWDELSRQVHWILLVHPGSDGLDPAENWRDVHKDRVTFTGYELVRLTRSGSERPAYTWRYTKETLEGLRSGCIQAIRHRSEEELKYLIEMIWRSVGFRGVRDQVKGIAKLIRSEWPRRHGKSVPPPIPKRLGYVRRVPDRWISLDQIARLNQSGEAHPSGSEMD